jgi:hypothetical protein
MILSSQKTKSIILIAIPSKMPKTICETHTTLIKEEISGEYKQRDYHNLLEL